MDDVADLLVIDAGALEELAGGLGRARPEIPVELDSRSHYLSRDADQAALFILSLDSLNFGSGFFADLDVPEDLKPVAAFNYFSFASCWSRFFKEHEARVSPQRLADLEVVDLLRIFQQDADNPLALELMELFTQALRDLRDFLETRGGAVKAIQAAGNSAVQLAEDLTEMPYFQDVAMAEGRRVEFYKRAQITPADLALAFRREGLGAFRDLDELTVFADNALPRILRKTGALKLVDGDLERKIAREELLNPGSRGELALRAGAVTACARLKQLLNHETSSTPWTAMQVDHVLWNRAQAMHGHGEELRAHRTQTVYY